MIYDVLILGAGPAGLSAAIYAGRNKQSVLLIEQGQDGGQISVTDAIENYPGQMLEGENGFTLSQRMAEQAKRFGAQRVSDTIREAKLDGEVKELVGASGTYRGRTLIIAAGAGHRSLGIPSEAALAGHGISYCATCDAGFFRGRDVYVAGGGDSAVQEALFLTRFARKVTLIHRRDALRAVPALQEKAFANEKLHFLWNSVVTDAGGDGKLQWLTIRNTKSGETTKIEAKPEDGFFGLFVFLGVVPATDLFKGKLDLEDGYIVTDENMHTHIPGVFAAGDIRKKKLRQVVTAAADGAIAAMEAYEYIRG